MRVTNDLLRFELERIWNDTMVRSPTCYLVWTIKADGPSWRHGRLATLRKSKAKRKVSRVSSQENS